MFIQIELKDSSIPLKKAELLVSLCPVEIFVIKKDQIEVQEDRLDECTLCELCLDAAPAGWLSIHKTYKRDPLVSRGEGS
ncbi:MAG: hypothetical protein MUO76_14125 [Anaerolineaceae bacterium]|jgi:ferredoxin-like protein FixX|nr:hypothetical protein [Anaerolineaceae bacterium]